MTEHPMMPFHPWSPSKSEEFISIRTGLLLAVTLIVALIRTIEDVSLFRASTTMATQMQWSALSMPKVEARGGFSAKVYCSPSTETEQGWSGSRGNPSVFSL